jgi:AcrR family transcriptional regulator
MGTRGRRPGSGDTRQAILEAARRAFAEAGFDRTRLRVIADDAGVDPSLIVHFFGSKRELYEIAVAVPPVPQTSSEELPADLESLAQRSVTDVLTYLDRDEVRSAFIAEVRSAGDSDALDAILDRYVFLPVNTYLFDGESGPATDLRYGLVRAEFCGLMFMRYVYPHEPVASAPVELLATAYAGAIAHLMTVSLEDIVEPASL